MLPYFFEDGGLCAERAGYRYDCSHCMRPARRGGPSTHGSDDLLEGASVLRLAQCVQEGENPATKPDFQQA